MTISIGTAGWSIPRACADQFPSEGSALSRYAARFRVTEINSSFHRPHRESTWERWRDSVPHAFQFSVKVPKAITHERKLIACAELIDDFLAQANILGDKLAVFLVQLPPKLEFNPAVAADFFWSMGKRTRAKIVCEPRNVSWFTTEADKLLEELKVARVAADPAICAAAALPGGWRGVSYWRLHGSPIIYRSSYGDRLEAYARALEEDANAGRDICCIFDNTAASAGTCDALALARLKATDVAHSSPD